jgi:hypothetical protein
MFLPNRRGDCFKLLIREFAKEHPDGEVMIMDSGFAPRQMRGG